jgi:isoquinoline 1-oxidoreductase alpha subunit
MASVTLKINGESVAIDVPADMPLLWTLRDKLNLVGTKYSCGIGVCGSCTVLVNGIPMRSCAMPAISMADMALSISSSSGSGFCRSRALAVRI